MAVTLNANTSTGFIATSDTSGVLQLQTGGTTALTVDASQQVGVGVTPSAWDATGKAIENPAGALYGYSTSQQLLTQNAFFDGAWKYKTTAQASYYQQSGGAHIWHTAASGTAGNTITFAERMRINAGAPILCLAGGNTSATGTGIAFPAVFNASSDVNTLDDYEEGTWTPLQGAGLTVVGTYSSSGRYTKIGRVVSISAYISASTSVACTGNGQICTGLPFTPASGENPAPMIVDPRNFSNSGSALPSGAVQNSTAISAVTGFSFSCTYFV